jgi:hypothetical protein
LDHIAQIYYSKKPPVAPGGFGNLISDLFSNFMSAPSSDRADPEFELGAEDVD